VVKAIQCYVFLIIFFLADFEGISARNLTYQNSPLPKIWIYSGKQMRATYHYGILYQLTDYMWL